ncbi:hypothetical protein [Bradyrhizobium sp. LHD-71]|uniref:hypothetical protein n=1 Tax=Bradyrhizobium sp. LHD-71 TaxID=3072141 RepID=UPI00280F329A|nr:hypothetical protein [Bradyrhizobium sp. LHD-71]MDQ8731127.1 hypothetical protein [Bradyrhizobium sp. LHD-71]
MLANTLLSTMTLLAVLGLAAAILMPTQSARRARSSGGVFGANAAFNSNLTRPVRVRSSWSAQSSQDWSLTRRD